jgi:hypothetical protein
MTLNELCFDNALRLGAVATLNKGFTVAHLPAIARARLSVVVVTRRRHVPGVPLFGLYR